MGLQVQRSFVAGELSPDLYARIDLEHYGFGCRTLKNFIVNYHGGAINRPGTRYIAETSDSSRVSTLVPFQFSTEHTYVLEFGHEYMRVYREGVQVESGGSPYEITTPYQEDEVFALRYTQSADTLTIVHPNHAPRQLTRTAHDSWTLSSLTFDPSISKPSAPTLTVNGTGTAITHKYVVTAVKDGDVPEESLASNSTSGTTDNLLDPETATIDISISAVSGAKYYNIYKNIDGVGAYGFLGSTEPGETDYTDIGLTPDYSNTAPTGREVFASAGKYPSTVNYYQQRLVFAGTDDAPQTIYASKVGAPTNFGFSIPYKDDDAITFTIASREVNRVRHLLALDELLALTSGAEWLVSGGDNQPLTAANLRLQAQSYRGSSDVPPLVIGNSALYVQDKGSVVRDLGYSLESDSFAGQDLTVRSTHLFEGRSIVQWAYCQAPYSVVWVVMSDGALLSFTYLPEQRVWGWAEHETDGEYESVCSVSEGDRDAAYFIVKRTIDGATVRYIERMESRYYSDDKLAFFVDSGLSLDNRNTAATTVALTGGTSWDNDEELTLTMSGDTFPASPEDNYYVLRAGDDYIRLLVISRDSSTTLTVRPTKETPASLQGTAVTDWEYAVDEISGLDHLEGETVSILADGNVEPQKVVTSGAITLEKHAAVVHAGLPYTCDLQTLDVDTARSETLRPKKLNIPRVFVQLKDSRGIFAGPDFDNMREAKTLEPSFAGGVIPSITGLIEVRVENNWRAGARVAIRQSDPLPAHVLAVTLDVEAGGA